MTPERPRSVRVASSLLYAAAGVCLATLGTSLWSMNHLHHARAGLFAAGGFGTEATDVVATIDADLRYQALVAVASGGLLTVHALQIRRPAPRARLSAWITALLVGIAWSCGIAQNTDTYTQHAGNPGPPELAAAYRALLPVWYADVTSVLSFCFLLALVAASISLLRTSSSEYYLLGTRGDSVVGLYRYARRPERPGGTTSSST